MAGPGAGGVPGVAAQGAEPDRQEDAGVAQGRLARLRETLGIGTEITRTLIVERDYYPGRTTVVLVREPIGV